MCFHSKQSKDAQTLEKRYKAKLENPELFKTGDVNGFEHPYCAIITNDKQEIIQFSLEKFKAHKQIRFLESSFIRPTSETYLQVGHGQELESFIKLLKKTK